LKIVVHFDADLTFRQIPNMAHGRFDNVFAAQIFANRLGFGRRLDDDQ
jgi:hypothetical protein